LPQKNWWNFDGDFSAKDQRLIGWAGGGRFFDARKFEGEGKFVGGRRVEVAFGLGGDRGAPVLPPISPFIGGNS
jgi:hypothetical protein